MRTHGSDVKRHPTSEFVSVAQQGCPHADFRFGNSIRKSLDCVNHQLSQLFEFRLYKELSVHL